LKPPAKTPSQLPLIEYLKTAPGNRDVVIAFFNRFLPEDASQELIDAIDLVAGFGDPWSDVPRRSAHHHSRRQEEAALKPRPQTHTDRLWHELSRISAAATIAKAFIQALPDGDTKIRLTALNDEIISAEHGAMQCATDIKAAAVSI
jgi:hypothetical protein